MLRLRSDLGSILYVLRVVRRIERDVQMLDYEASPLQNVYGQQTHPQYVFYCRLSYLLICEQPATLPAAPLQPETHPLPPPLPESRPQTPPPIRDTGFVPDNQWQLIQDFNTTMDMVEMELCSRCQERWFSMNLKDTVCHKCYLRDRKTCVPYLMSAANQMDPGVVPDYLPELSQLEEMIIARSHVQMMVFRYRGHQYHYSGHCVSFMQNTARTVNVLPNLPAELDIVLIRPSNTGDDTRFSPLFDP